MKTKTHLKTLYVIIASLTMASEAVAAEMLANKQEVSILTFLPLFLVAILGWFMFYDESKKSGATAKQNTPKRKAPEPKQIVNTSNRISKEKPVEKSSSGLTDLSKNVAQCQAETAKGSRCKRTNNLETTIQTFKNKRYQFTSCTQHNTDKFKPHPTVLK